MALGICAVIVASKLSCESLQVITATPRQLESMVRISESLAKMRLSPTVEQPDVAEALRLMKVQWNKISCYL